MMPNSQVLMNLARALDVSEECLLGEQHLARDGVEFRKNANMSAKEEAQVEVHVLRLLERYLAIERILGIPIEWDESRERRLERPCYRALTGGAVSDAQAAGLLGISARELNRRLDELERAGVFC